MDKYEVAVLAEDYERKRMAFEMHQRANVANLTPDERVKASIEYHIAEAELIDAMVALNKAKHSV